MAFMGQSVIQNPVGIYNQNFNTCYNPSTQYVNQYSPNFNQYCTNINQFPTTNQYNTCNNNNYTVNNYFNTPTQCQPSGNTYNIVNVYNNYFSQPEPMQQQIPCQQAFCGQIPQAQCDNNSISNIMSMLLMTVVALTGNRTYQ